MGFLMDRLIRILKTMTFTASVIVGLYVVFFLFAPAIYDTAKKWYTNSSW